MPAPPANLLFVLGNISAACMPVVGVDATYPDNLPRDFHGNRFLLTTDHLTRQPDQPLITGYLDVQSVKVAAESSHHTFAAFHLNERFLGDSAPQQACAHHRAEGGVFQALGVGAQLQGPVHQTGIDPQLIVDPLDTFGGQSHLLGQRLLHRILNIPGESRLLAIDFHLYRKRVEHGIEGQGCLQRPFQTSILHGVGLGRRDHRQGTGSKYNHSRVGGHKRISLRIAQPIKLATVVPAI
ncbi:hypothetical protein WR25_17931 [Diploscapter pachys]|uniref:Secreted protein n=1 Tax=Diploscapter pachys TaxID=2018661 RepID=A0A2A2K639_9BILA|nr:hypothetical protein WR25_17931 [Diploscapter pachys]